MRVDKLEREEVMGLLAADDGTGASCNGRGENWPDPTLLLPLLGEFRAKSSLGEVGDSKSGGNFIDLEANVCRLLLSASIFLA